jgi:aspartate racemase
MRHNWQMDIPLVSSNMQAKAEAAPYYLPETIGIIGGMGPDAGVDLTYKFLRECRVFLREHDLPINDQSYPPHILVQHPVPDRSQAFVKGDTTLAGKIIDACRIATDAGATTLGIACNTAHLWYSEIASAIKPVKILHIAEIAAQTALDLGFQRVALMATPVTCASQIYHDALGRHGLHVVDMTSGQLEDVNRAIFEGVKGGNFDLAQSLTKRVASELLDRVDCVVLGCTELPIVLGQAAGLDHDRMIDATAALATALAKAAFRRYELSCR